MKTIQSMDDIKKASDSVTLPSIDIRQNVMQKINSRREGKNMLVRKKLIIGITAAVFLICSVGFTVAKVWELNGPGNIPFKFSLFKASHSHSLTTTEEWKNVKPGGALAILRIEGYSKNIISISLKPLLINSINVLKERVGEGFKAPADLPEGYSFSEGQINTGFDDVLRDSMLEEAKSSKKDVVRVIEPSQDVGSYTIIYKNQNKEIDVSLTYNYKWPELSQPDKGQKVSEIDVNSFKAIYTDGNGRTEIKWIDSSNNANIMYSIGCPKGHAAKDELLRIAGSLY